MRFYKGTCTTMELDSSFVKTFSQDLQNCRDLFAALGDQVRQQILLALTHSTVPGMRVGEITAKTKLSRPAVSHHIRILKNAGIIDVIHFGTKNYYYLNTASPVWKNLLQFADCMEPAVQKSPKKHCTAGETISVNSAPMNLLVTLNASYLAPLNVMLFSLMRSNPTEKFNIYLLHNNLSEELLLPTRKILGGNSLYPIQVQEPQLKDAPVSKRYPQEMYFRIFAAQYLPEGIDRVLYLDPDIIINGSLRELYETPMDTELFAAASHIRSILHKFNEIRLDMEEDGTYINSGVMLMNLKRLRQEQNVSDVFTYIEQHKNKLMLPDQDVISGMYGSRIIPVDPYRYNMTERLFTFPPTSQAWLNLEWVRQNTVCIHYCGRNKPWKNSYTGKLDIFYKETESQLQLAFSNHNKEK